MKGTYITFELSPEQAREYENQIQGDGQDCLLIKSTCHPGPSGGKIYIFKDITVDEGEYVFFLAGRIKRGEATK